VTFNSGFLFRRRRARMQSFLKWLAILFSLFILAVIFAADRGLLGPLRGLYDFPHGDKAGHFLLYGLLSFLLILYILARPRPNPGQIVLITAGLLMILIALEELSQFVIPTRTMDFVDLMFSFAGVGVFSFLAYRMKTK
jgi:hypothetical protein